MVVTFAVGSSDGNRLESSTSIIGGPHRFDNRLIIEMRTLVQWALLNQFWDKISSSLNDTYYKNISFNGSS